MYPDLVTEPSERQVIELPRSTWTLLGELEPEYTLPLIVHQSQQDSVL